MPETPEFDWFADSPFNLLVDYYPEVAFRPYASGATPENVLPVLRDLDLARNVRGQWHFTPNAHPLTRCLVRLLRQEPAPPPG